MTKKGFPGIWDLGRGLPLEALGLCWDGRLQRLQWQFWELFRCVWANKKVLGVVGTCWKGSILFGFSVAELELDPTGKKHVWSIFWISMVNFFFSFENGIFYIPHVSILPGHSGEWKAASGGPPGQPLVGLRGATTIVGLVKYRDMTSGWEEVFGRPDVTWCWRLLWMWHFYTSFDVFFHGICWDFPDPWSLSRGPRWHHGDQRATSSRAIPSRLLGGKLAFVSLVKLISKTSRVSQTLVTLVEGKLLAVETCLKPKMGHKLHMVFCIIVQIQGQFRWESAIWNQMDLCKARGSAVSPHPRVFNSV